MKRSTVTRKLRKPMQIFFFKGDKPILPFRIFIELTPEDCDSINSEFLLPTLRHILGNISDLFEDPSPKRWQDLESRPVETLRDALWIMKSFFFKIEKTGVQPVFYNTLTASQLYDFLRNIERRGVDTVFQSCCVVPSGTTQHDYLAFVESIRKIYS